MTFMEVMAKLVDEQIGFEFSAEYGAQNIYVYGRKNEKGFKPYIRISTDEGRIYRRNCGIVGYVTMGKLLEEIREL